MTLRLPALHPALSDGHPQPASKPLWQHLKRTRPPLPHQPRGVFGDGQFGGEEEPARLQLACIEGLVVRFGIALRAMGD